MLRGLRHIGVTARTQSIRFKSSINVPGRIVVISSGKGGVGKTTTAASFAMGLAEQGYKTCAVDFDIGLRNLDIHLGCERRVILDFVNVLQNNEAGHYILLGGGSRGEEQ